MLPRWGEARFSIVLSSSLCSHHTLKADLAKQSLNFWSQLPVTYHRRIRICSIQHFLKPVQHQKGVRLSLTHKEETKQSGNFGP